MPQRHRLFLYVFISRTQAVFKINIAAVHSSATETGTDARTGSTTRPLCSSIVCAAWGKKRRIAAQFTAANAPQTKREVKKWDSFTPHCVM